MSRRIKVTGVRKTEVSPEDLSLIFWLQAKRVLREKREREAQAKAKSSRKEKREDRHER